MDLEIPFDDHQLDSKVNKKLVINGKWIIREHYLRDDISCRVSLCEHCAQQPDSDANQPMLFLNPQDELVIPTIDVALRYLDLFETNSKLRNVVFCETHFKHMQPYKRLYTRLKQLVAVPKFEPSNATATGAKEKRQKTVSVRCALFCNEHCRETFITRQNDESAIDRDDRAIAFMAQWYYDHLEGLVSPVVLALNDEQLARTQSILDRMQTSSKVKVETIHQFVQRRFADDRVMIEQLEALTAALKEPLSADDINFDDHLPTTALEQGLKNGSFLKGVLQVNKFNTQEAIVKTGQRTIEDEDEGDQVSFSQIVISGSVHRNRAIHGDLVVVQLLPEVDWVSATHGKKKDAAKEGSTSAGVDDVQQGEAALVPTARVVGILQRNSRDFVCCIQMDKSELEAREAGEITASSASDSSKGEHVLCIPMDKRIPKFRIKTRQRKQLENSRIIVRFSEWPADSMYPAGYYVETIGEIGDLNTETRALLIENKLVENSLAFSKLALSELPQHTPEKPYKIPKEEYERRRDIRFTHWVMSIDPIGCEDIDDALSVRELKNGHLEFGVHIADCEVFVRHNSALDLEARKRATTIYLVDRRLDMLPTILSADLCSLHQGRDRFAVSVFWEITKAGKVVKTEFVRTLMRNKYALHYAQAQDIIDGKDHKPVESTGNWREAKVASEDMTEVRKQLILIQDYASRIRKQRTKFGALVLESLEEVKIKLDKDSSKPLEIQTKEHLPVHETVEEWMIFANHVVGKKIYESFPDSALLRRHPYPKQESFEQLQKTARMHGFVIDTSSNSALASSLDAAQDPNDRYVNLLLRALATRAMQEAQYFSTGQFAPSEFYHYGLALDYYTHFTSPIRRYADQIVHRLLLLAMEQDAKEIAHKNTLFDTKQLVEISDHINEKNRASKIAQMESVEWFRSLYLREVETVQDAIIYSIRKDQLFVFCPAFSLKGLVRMISKEGELILAEEESKELEPGSWDGDVSFEPESLRMTVTLSTTRAKGGKSNRKQTFHFHVFDHVSVKLAVKEARAHLPQVKMLLQTFAKRNRLMSPTGAAFHAKQLYMEQYLGQVAEQKDQEAKLYMTATDVSGYTQQANGMYSIVRELYEAGHTTAGAKSATSSALEALSVADLQQVSHDDDMDLLVQREQLLDKKRRYEKLLAKLQRKHSQSSTMIDEPAIRQKLSKIEAQLSQLQVSG